MIQLREVRFHYAIEGVSSKEWVLSGLNLSIPSGEYVAVMGPNGSGKSTMARMLNGLLVPTGGQVLIDGLDTRNDEALWEIRQRVGMVFQNPDNQIVATTVRDDIAFGLENRGMPREEMIPRIEEVIAEVGLDGLEETPPHHLSGGQKQRLAIAGVIAMRPRVVVFDEATSMLDPTGRGEVLEAIRRLHEGGTTIVHITHSADEALEAERIMIMAGGRLQLEGTPAEVFSRAEALSRWSLDVPFHVKLREGLIRRGMPLSEKTANTEELVEELWGLLSKG
ncbi:energy-coupling factor transporter ATPase [Salinithrix halophila]|uniref:energy-coupling factor transporter ATPase n=1 Tax=Salinithrix halophila TaxID=1485204 RepID=UPI0036D386A9